MFISSITDENTVDISLIYQRLSLLNNKMILRDKWSKFAQIISRNNRINIANKLIQYEKSSILYKQKRKKKVFERWKFRKRWIDFYNYFTKEQIHKRVLYYKETQKQFSYKNKRATWKRLAQLLIRRNRYTYLIVDVSDLFNFRRMRTCFQFWVERLSYSTDILRNKWKYLVSKRMHREVILRIYNVQSVFHTRIIWREFVDRILHQYYQNEILIAKNTEIIRQRWIFISRGILHKQNLNRLYQVKSKLKTKVVWKYFMSSVMIKSKRSIFRNLQKQYIFNKEKSLSIRAKWEKLFTKLLIYSHKQSIPSIIHFLEMRSAWRNLTRKLYFSSLHKSLNEGLIKINEKKEQIRQRILLKSSFDHWFGCSISGNKMIEIYNDALSIFVPTFQRNSAIIIQRNFRLFLQRRKYIHDMIFNNISFDSLIHPLFYEVPNHFLPPIHHPKKVWDPFVDLISISESQTNYNLNFYHTNKRQVDSSFILECFSEIGLNELNFFSTDKDFPTPQMEPIISDIDFDDFDMSIKENLDLFKKENVPKFSERQIQEDVIQYIQVEPEFENNMNQIRQIHFKYLNRDDIIEKVLDKETEFEVDDTLDSWLDFNHLFNHQNHLNNYSAKKEIPQTEARFGVVDVITENSSSLIDFQNDENQFNTLLISNDPQISMHRYRPIQFIEQDEYDHIFDTNESFYLTMNEIDSLEIDESCLNLLQFVEMKESVFREINNNNNICSKEDEFIQFDASLFPLPIHIFLSFFFISPTLVDALFRPCYETVHLFFEDDSFIFTFPFDFITFYRTFRSQCVDIQQQHNKQVSALSFDVDDRLIQKGQSRRKSFSLKYALFQTGNNLLFNEDYFVKGFFFTPRISRFCSIDKMIDQESYSEMTTIEPIDLDLNLQFSSPINSTVDDLIDKSRSKSVNELASQPLFEQLEFDPQIDFQYLSTFRQKKRKEESNEVIQDECVESYLNQCTVPLFEMDIDGFNQKLDPPNFFNLPGIQLEKRPFDAISFYLSETIDSSIISLHEFTFDMANFNFSRKDDKSFLNMKAINSITGQIMIRTLNAIPIVSNLPSSETIREITNDFLSSVPLSPPRLVQGVKKLEFLDSKDPTSLVRNEEIESQVGQLLNGIQFPLVKNKVEDEFNVDLDVNFNDLIGGIASQVSVDNLQHMTANDERALINNDVLDSLLNSNQQSILNLIPLNSNLPQDETLLEISNDFEIFNETVQTFASFGLENQSLLNYTMNDDRKYYDDEFNDHLALNILNDEMEGLPLVPNVPDEDDISSIAGEFYEFCEINTKVPLSPIKRIEMKDDRSFFSNQDSLNEFSSLLNSIDLPISSNMPDEDTVDEIADVFYDASDIFCYFSGLEDIVPLILFERKDDISFSPPFYTDQIYTQMLFNEIEFPIVPNIPDKETIDQISTQLIENVEKSCFGFLLSSLNININYQRKDDRAFLDCKMSDRVMTIIFNSIFNTEEIICQNEPEEEDINEIVEDFVDFNADSFSKGNIFPLSNLGNKDERMYVNEKIVSNIVSDILESIFRDERILYSNEADDETVTEIINDFVDDNVSIFSFVNASSLNKFERKDDIVYLNSKMVDKIIWNIFDSIFDDEKGNIFCQNLLDDETTEEIVSDLVNTSVVPFASINVSPLSIYKVKDDLAFVDNEIADKVTTIIFDSIFNTEEIICLNVPEEEDINEIVENFIDFGVDSFSVGNTSPLSNIENKDERIYVNERNVSDVASNMFETIFRNEKILYRNVPEEVKITEIIQDFVDDDVDPFSLINISSLSMYEVKDDRAFIESNRLDQIEDQLLNSELNSIPIVLNSLNPESAEEIIRTPEFNESFCDYSEFASSNKILKPMKNYTLKDEKCLSSWEKSEQIAISIIPVDLPITLNELTDTELIQIFEFVDFKQVLQDVVSNKFEQNRIRFCINDDRAYLKEEEVEALYFNVFFNSMDNCPLTKNEPSKLDIDEIASDIIYNIDLHSIKSVLDTNFKVQNSLNHIEQKDPKSYFTLEKIDDFALSLITDLPLVENDIDSSTVNEITDFIMKKNKVFTFDFNTPQHSNSLSLLSPKERRINVDNDVVNNLAINEFNQIITIKLPIVRNTVNNDEVNQILTFVDHQLQFPIFKANNALSPLLNLDPNYRRIEIDKDILFSLVDDILEESIDCLAIVKNTFDYHVPFDIVYSINLLDTLTFLPQFTVNPIFNIFKKDKKVAINDDFYESLLLKILYENVLPMMPIRENKTNNKFSFYTYEDNKTEIFFEDEDYNESY